MQNNNLLNCLTIVFFVSYMFFVILFAFLFLSDNKTETILLKNAQEMAEIKREYHALSLQLQQIQNNDKKQNHKALETISTVEKRSTDLGGMSHSVFPFRLFPVR